MTAEILAIRGDRESWLAWRRQGIGGSDAAAVCGLDPYRTPYALFLEKMGVLDSAEENERMLWGRLLEPPIADEFERRQGLWVCQRQLMSVHPERSWQRATLDGKVFDNPAGDGASLGIYEGKTTHAHWESDWAEGVPERYTLQIQHNMAVTDDERAYVTCLIGGQKLVIHVVERDDELIGMLVDLETDFWRRVQEGTPPPIDGSEATADAIRAAFPMADPGEAVELPDEALELVREIEAAQAEEKVAHERLQQAKSQLMAQLGGAAIGMYAGRELVTWKSVTARRLDSDALKQAHPEIVAEFTKESSYRRFLTKKTKEE